MWYDADISNSNSPDKLIKFKQDSLDQKKSKKDKNEESTLELHQGLSHNPKGEDEEEEDTVQNVKLLFGGSPRIVESYQTNKWLVYNPYIKFGYRTNYNTHKILLKSACSCHNETGNFWTHALGAIIFIGVVFYSMFFWSPLRLEHTQFITRMKEKNWGDFIHANNYDDIVSYFKAITQEGIKGFRVYDKLNSLWESNSSLFIIGSDEFKQGI